VAQPASRYSRPGRATPDELDDLLGISLGRQTSICGEGPVRPGAPGVDGAPARAHSLTERLDRCLHNWLNATDDGGIIPGGSAFMMLACTAPGAGSQVLRNRHSARAVGRASCLRP